MLVDQELDDGQGKVYVWGLGYAPSIILKGRLLVLLVVVQ